MSNFEVAKAESGKIIDFLEGIELEPTPEEFIRQRYLRVLHYEYQYPKNLLAREIPVYYGSKELKDSLGNLPPPHDFLGHTIGAYCPLLSGRRGHPISLAQFST